MGGATGQGSRRPPVIVTGMHRSGTTMLVELLRKSGAFFGANRDPNAEDYFFMRLNEWIMRRAGGAWDYPLPTRRYLDFERFFADTLAFISHRVAETGAAEHALPWGWKDPRAVFTLRLWEQVFPGARLLYIRRNGVDSANSLFVRERDRWLDGRRDSHYLQIRPLIGRLRDAIPRYESFENYLFSTRCLTLEESFRLWEEYVEEGEALFEWFPGPKMDIRYESLIEEPEAHLQRVLTFCGLELDPTRLRDLISWIDPVRAYAFVGNADLCHFYEQIKNTPLMQRLGYGAIRWDKGAP